MLTLQIHSFLPVFSPQKSGGLAALQQLAVPDLTERYMAALDVARQGEEAAKKGPSVEVAAATGFVKVGFRELHLQAHVGDASPT